MARHQAPAGRGEPAGVEPSAARLPWRHDARQHPEPSPDGGRTLVLTYDTKTWVVEDLVLRSETSSPSLVRMVFR
jgi:hypothetical protein